MLPDDLEAKKIRDVAIENPTRIINPTRPQAKYLPTPVDSRSFMLSHLNCCPSRYQTHGNPRVQMVYAKIHLRTQVLPKVQMYQMVRTRVSDPRNLLTHFVMYTEPCHFQHLPQSDVLFDFEDSAQRTYILDILARLPSDLPLLCH